MRLLLHHGRKTGALSATVAVLAVPVTELRAEALPGHDRYHTTDSISAAPSQGIDRLIAEAARRFGVPERWIEAVIASESGGDPRALSPKGAMGLMQVMPGTWADLTGRHRLGADPYDPRANVLAGTAYLRELYDRFGFPGALAAYNAGPGRYGEHVETRRPLPRETRIYVARVLRSLDDAAAASLPSGDLPTVFDWRETPLFVPRPDAESAAARASEPRPSRRSTAASSDASGAGAGAMAEFFVPARTGFQP